MLLNSRVRLFCSSLFLLMSLISTILSGLLFASSTSLNSLLLLQLSSIGTTSGTVFTQSAPPGTAYSTVRINFGSDFIASNICSTATVFGLSGSATCPISGTELVVPLNALLASTALRTALTKELPQNGEVSTYTGIALPATGGYSYRDVPKQDYDSDGYPANNDNTNLISNVVVNATRPGLNCGEPTSMSGSGITPSTLAHRIQHCSLINGTSATWNGSLNGNAGQGLWTLVTRFGANHEVWQDQRTQLLWSSVVANTVAWCPAAGSHQVDGICNSNTVSYCAEVLAPNASVEGTNGSWSSVYAPQKGLMGLNSTPAVVWRLPTRYDYLQAEIDGLRFVMPEGLNQSTTPKEWTATTDSTSTDHQNAYYFKIDFGGIQGSVVRTATSTMEVRCVGH